MMFPNFQLVMMLPRNPVGIITAIRKFNIVDVLSALYAIFFDGHTINTCYKIHGYPPGFKSKMKNPSRSPSVVINQASDSSIIPDGSIFPTPSTNFLNSLDTTQMEQLMALFASHSSIKKESISTPDEVGTSNYSGTCLSISVPNLFSTCWIEDSGLLSAYVQMLRLSFPCVLYIIQL